MLIVFDLLGVAGQIGHKQNRPQVKTVKSAPVKSAPSQIGPRPKQCIIMFFLFNLIICMVNCVVYLIPNQIIVLLCCLFNLIICPCIMRWILHKFFILQEGVCIINKNNVFHSFFRLGNHMSAIFVVNTIVNMQS